MITQIVQELPEISVRQFILGGIMVSVALSLFPGLPIALFSRKGSFMNRVCWGLQKYTIFTVSLFALPFAVIAFFTRDAAGRLPILAAVMSGLIVLSILVWARAPKPMGKKGSMVMRILE